MHLMTDAAGHDAHCHLDLFPDPSRAYAARRASRILTIAVTTTPAAYSQNRAWADGNPYVVPALGLHPELVEQRPGDVGKLLDLMPTAKLIGEVGIDGSPQHEGSFDNQSKAFERIVGEACRLGGRTLSIHSRRATKPVLDIIDACAGRDRARFILHWFSGSMSDLRRASDLGCWFSVNGSMLASAKGRELIRAMPDDRLLMETDAPFRSDDALVGQRTVCELKGIDPSSMTAKLLALLGSDR